MVSSGVVWVVDSLRPAHPTAGGGAAWRALTIEWAGGDAPVRMTGPAEFVFEGEIEL